MKAVRNLAAKSLRFAIAARWRWRRAASASLSRRSRYRPG